MYTAANHCLSREVSTALKMHVEVFSVVIRAVGLEHKISDTDAFTKAQYVLIMLNPLKWQMAS
jgi:hypothetical protein